MISRVIPGGRLHGRPVSTNDRRELASLDPVAWAVTPYSWASAEVLSRGLDVPLVAAMVLAGRGLTDPVQARAFLDCSDPLPDPFLNR